MLLQTVRERITLNAAVVVASNMLGIGTLAVTRLYDKCLNSDLN